MKYIPLTGIYGRGKCAIIDDEDYEKVTSYPHPWRALKNHRDNRLYVVTYVYRGLKGTTISLHRFLMNAKPGTIADHKNGDGLDNRRCNLRFTDQRGNSWNSVKPKNNTSGYKGVSKYRNGWRTCIKCDDKVVPIGTFKDKHHAALAYDLWATDVYGEFARTNFPVVAHS